MGNKEKDPWEGHQPRIDAMNSLESWISTLKEPQQRKAWSILADWAISHAQCEVFDGTVMGMMSKEMREATQLLRPSLHGITGLLRHYGPFFEEFEAGESATFLTFRDGEGKLYLYRLPAKTDVRSLFKSLGMGWTTEEEHS